MEEDLVNKRFDEHRQRQALPLEVEDEESSSSSSYFEDKSRKGSVDLRILPLVSSLNSTNNIFTTSTCSGRVILLANTTSINASDPTTSTSSKKIKKKGCQWLMVTHDEVKAEELLDAWNKACGSQDFKDISFKVEPAILHVQCRTLSSAKKLIHTATESGFRNSGMVIGKDNRITVAIRSTLGLEVPLPASDPALITHSYIIYLASQANEKMIENWRRMDKLTEEFRKVFVEESKSS